MDSKRLVCTKINFLGIHFGTGFVYKKTSQVRKSSTTIMNFQLLIPYNTLKVRNSCVWGGQWLEDDEHLSGIYGYDYLCE